MDAVILAAGRGTRLDGIAAPFHKPLLVVNGKPLVRRCVEVAMETAGGEIVVVAAPENAAPIAHVLNGAGLGNVDIIIQRTALGPGDALLTGMKLVTSDTMLVLLGDNVVSYEDVGRVVTAGYRNVIGVNSVPPEQAEPFTRLRRRSDNTLTWVEKVPVTDDDVYEGETTCWVGPIKVETTKMEKAIRKHTAEKGEIPIGPMFNHLGDFYTIKVSSIDIGTPEAL